MGLGNVDWIKKNNMVRVVDSGSDTSFWCDHWLEDELLYVWFSRLFGLACNKNVSVVDMVRSHCDANIRGWRWMRRC